MKKLVFKILLWTAIIVVLDICFGVVMSYLYRNSKGGETYKQVYISEKSNENILIFGSSRASHHYDPRIFQDSLGMSCFNCGYDGMGIIINYCNFKMLTERYSPKCILYDITPTFDYLDGDNERYLGRLRPLYFRNGEVRNVVSEIDKSERVKCLSSLYNYNGLAIQIVQDFLFARYGGIEGYLPIKETMLKEPNEYNDNDDPFNCLDSLKIKYLSKFINDCRQKKITLIFCISPYYKRSDLKEYEPLFDIARKNNIPILDYSVEPAIYNDLLLFSDGTHLNEVGAEKYSRIVVHDIRCLLN